MTVRREEAVRLVVWRGLARLLATALALRLRLAARVAYTTLQLLALATSIHSYRGPARQALERQLWRNTWPQLPAFLALGGLLSVVLIQIVWTTAQSHGLSHVALEMMVRVLALELLPLLAALFVALRCSLPMAAELSALPMHGRSRLGWLREAVFPRAAAVVFAVCLLTAAIGLLALGLAYAMVYGFSPWGAGAFAHAVSRVFSPWVTVVFAVKTLGFGLAVGVVPLAHVAAVRQSGGADPTGPSGPAQSLAALARLAGVLLLVEIAALMAYL